MDKMQAASSQDESESELEKEEIEKRQLKRAHRSNSDPTVCNQNINLRKKVNLGGPEIDHPSSSNTVFNQLFQADFSNFVSMNGLLDGSFLNSSLFFENFPDLMGDLAQKVEPVQKNITDFEPLVDDPASLDSKSVMAESQVGDLEYQLSRNSLMDDSAWSSGDIDKDLIAQVNDPNFWQKNMKDSELSTPNSLKSSQIHNETNDNILQDFTFGSITSFNNREDEEEQFHNINRKEALDIVSAPNSNNSVAILQEYLPNTSLDPNSINLSEVFTSFPDSVISVPAELNNALSSEQNISSNIPSRELPREDSFLPSVPVPLSSRASFTAGRQNAQRWNHNPVEQIPLQSPAMQSIAGIPAQPSTPLNMVNTFHLQYPTSPQFVLNNSSSYCQPVMSNYHESSNALTNSLFSPSPSDQTPTTEEKKKQNATVSSSKDKASNRGNYRCGRCGQPKVNHNCKVTDAIGVTVGIQTTSPVIDLQSLLPFSGERFVTVTVDRRSINDEGNEVTVSSSNISLAQLAYGAPPPSYNSHVDMPIALGSVNTSPYAAMDLPQSNPYFNYYSSNSTY